MARGGKQRDSRDDRERARVYQARREFHEGRARRRTRDDIIAGVGGGLLILAVIGGQTAYFVAGPGKPLPVPSATPDPGASATPDPASTGPVVPESTTVPDPSPTPTP